MRLEWLMPWKRQEAAQPVTPPVAKNREDDEDDWLGRDFTYELDGETVTVQNCAFQGYLMRCLNRGMSRADAMAYAKRNYLNEKLQARTARDLMRRG